MSLSKIDSFIKFENIETSLENIVGNYYYQYSEAGYQGKMKKKLHFAYYSHILLSNLTL